METIEQNPLDKLVEKAKKGDLSDIVKLILWKGRHDNPDFTIQINPADLAGFQDCVTFLQQSEGMEGGVKLNIVRPGGVPASEGIAPRGNREGRPPRPAIPPKEYLIVQMTDAKGNGFKPIENNETDYAEAQKAERKRRAKDQARILAAEMVGQAQRGEYSSSTIMDAAGVLQVLAQG
jgi:hypothetical protein